MNYFISDRISQLKPSAIREILKFTSDPSVIPFAAGNPAPDAFPVELVNSITRNILDKNPITALQYGVTEGYAPLIEQVNAMVKNRNNIGKDFDKTIITAGAQQVMDLATKVLCNENDTIICENPSFIGSLNCFRSYKVNLCGIEIEDDGMNIEKLEHALQTQKNVRYIYTIPNFQNPSGVTMSLEKRKAVYELAKKYNVLIIEDNPYGELRVSGNDVPCIKSMDEDGIVIYAGSFSKILSPGLRVGFAIAPEAIISKMIVGKQAVDVHTPMLNQMIVSDWMKECNFDEHIAYLQSIYRKKLNLMCDGIDEKFPKEISYVRPEGGLFVWATLPENVNMPEFCKQAVLNKVAVVPGNAFTMDANDPTQSFRMNFSTPTDENLVRGVEILSTVAKDFIK